MTKAPPRVRFDTNEGTYDHGYWLVLEMSLVDLRAIEDLRDGLEVTLHMPEELEMRARLRFAGPAEFDPFDFPNGAWVADPIPGTIIHLD